ncbi:MAG: acylneuraminate cytidylyltransferase, partial [uncultured bacterium]
MAPLINIFIQARLSSERFPGKVLAPLHQQPLIKHVVNCARSVREINQVVVLTSDNESDDPLVAYLEKIPCCYVRGDLENVFVRFQKALRDFPCDYFVRLSADSPFINSDLIQFMIS